MKKAIITIITAMLTIGAMAQVNAVGIPFGMGKYEARQLLRSKYGEPAYSTINMIMYANFRLDGVSYETASFFFDDDMKFTSASFSRPDQKTAEALAADAKAVADILEQQYLVVNLYEHGANQSYTQNGQTIMTIYRAAPRQLINGRPAYMVNIIGHLSDDGSNIVVNYTLK